MPLDIFEESDGGFRLCCTEPPMVGGVGGDKDGLVEAGGIVEIGVLRWIGPVEGPEMGP